MTAHYWHLVIAGLTFLVALTAICGFDTWREARRQARYRSALTRSRQRQARDQRQERTYGGAS